MKLKIGKRQRKSKKQTVGYLQKKKKIEKCRTRLRKKRTLHQSLISGMKWDNTTYPEAIKRILRDNFMLMYLPTKKKWTNLSKTANDQLNQDEII